VELSLDQRQTKWRKLLFGSANRQLQAFINAILPITSTEPAPFGVYADDFVLKVEDLARASNHAEKTTTVSCRGVDGSIYGFSSMIGRDR